MPTSAPDLLPVFHALPGANLLLSPDGRFFAWASPDQYVGHVLPLPSLFTD